MDVFNPKIAGLSPPKNTMPIPLLIWGALTVAGSIAGAINTASAVDRLKQAEDRYAERKRRYDDCLRACEERKTQAMDRIDSLVRTRLQASVTLGEAVKFLERARVKDRDLLERFSINEQQVIEWKTAAVDAGEVISGILRAAAGGVAASAATYGMVGSLAAASTGTAISSLSGAAATNATFAWLGGGTLAAGGGGVAAGTLVLSGIMTAPFLLCTSLVMHGQAEKVETETERNIANLDENEAQQWRLHEEANILILRVNELESSMLSLEAELKKVIEASNPESDEDAYRVAKAATVLGLLLEQKAIPKS